MICGKCNGTNDPDAVFCTDCGQPLAEMPGKVPLRQRKSFWYALLLVPVLLAAAGIGYYKFVLPNGVAAVVNGEEITLTELDAAAVPTGNGRSVPVEIRDSMRYEALLQLITERIACQEARKAGVRVSTDEVNAAADRMRSLSGMDEKNFDARMTARYGSMGSFRRGLERRLAVRKLIDEQITAGITDPSAARARINQWLEDITGKASVRMALAEELPASGCGCCGGGRGPAKGAGNRGCGISAGPAAGAKEASAQGEAARTAALAYWQQKNGGGTVETKVTDFGCHIQVDIVTNNRIAKSLRYQNGTISEM